MYIRPTHPRELVPLHSQVRNKRFVSTGSRIIAHSPSKSAVSPRLDYEQAPTRSPALLEINSTTSNRKPTSAGVAVAWGDEPYTRGSSARGSSAASESSQGRLLGSAASSLPEDEVQLCAAGFGMDGKGKSPFPANTPPLADPEQEEKARQEAAEEKERKRILREEIDGEDSRPVTHHSKRSQASIRHVELQDDVFVEDRDRSGEGDEDEAGKQGQAAPDNVQNEENNQKEEGDEAVEGILDSPEIANRRAALKAKMHRLSLQSTHDMIGEVDDHAFEKRARIIRKRFKLMPWMVRERNMLWFAPPIDELEGQSLGMFGEWDPVRLLCVDLLSNPILQTAFFVINTVALAVLAVRPAREDVVYEYDVYGEPKQAPYYQLGNVYFVAEVIAFLTLAVEIFLTVVARGLIKGHYAFVKDPFNILDAVILVVSFLEFVLWAMGWTIILRGFRVLRMLKPMMLLNVFEGCRGIVTGIRNSAEFVPVIYLIVVVLQLAFAAGLPLLFGSPMHGRCVHLFVRVLRVFVFHWECLCLFFFLVGWSICNCTARLMMKYVGVCDYVFVCHLRCVVERTDTQYTIDRFNNTQRVRVAFGHGYGFCKVYNITRSLQGFLTSDDSCPKQANPRVAAVTAGAVYLRLYACISTVVCIVFAFCA